MKSGIKLIIAGSRCITNPTSLEYAFKNSPYSTSCISEVVCGNAKGVDTLGKEFAYNRGIKVSLWKPDWDRHGKSAGIIRNVEMGKHGDALLAVWDGKSSGTKHMIEYMQSIGKQIFIYNDQTGQIIQINAKEKIVEPKNIFIKHKLKTEEDRTNAYSN